MATRPTARAVAEAAGVSLATVSLVFNGKPGVGEQTRRRVLETIESLGYQGRSDRSAIGVLVERLPVSVFSDPAVGLMIQGIEEEVQRQDYHMLLATIEPQAQSLPAMVTQRQVGGVIMLGGGDVSDWYIAALVATGTPVVLADNFVAGLAVPCVLADNTTGAFMVTRHLIELGHRRIAFLEGPRKYKTLTERLEGYLRALDMAGIAPDPTLMIQPIHGQGRKGYREVQALLALPRERWPTAVFAVSDKTALGALEALKDAGLRVPQDVALAGFDCIAESELARPQLTSVRYPMREIGQVAAQHVIESIEQGPRVPRKTVLYTELLIGQSSGGPLRAEAHLP